MSTDRSRPRARKSPTSGRATIYSVAERAGVSIATVSRVLSGTAVTSPEATEKVLKAAHDLAYVPQNSAKSLASARYQTHAVVIGSLDGPYYSELLMGYEEVAARYDQELLLVVADRPRRTLADLRARVDGVMIAQMDIPDAEIAALAALIPVVAVGRAQIDGCDVVISESTATAHALTRHLIDVHARRRLVFVGAPDQSSDVAARHAGFEAALTESGLRPLTEPLRVPYTESGGGRGRRSGARSPGLPGRPGLRQRRGRSRARRRSAAPIGRPRRGPLTDRLGRRDSRSLRHPRPHHRPPARSGDGRTGRRAAPPTGQGLRGTRRAARAGHRGGDPAVLRLPGLIDTRHHHRVGSTGVARARPVATELHHDPAPPRPAPPRPSALHDRPNDHDVRTTR